METKINKILSTAILSTVMLGASMTEAQSAPDSSGDTDHLHFGLFGEVRYDDNIGFSGDSKDEVDDITTTVKGDLSWDFINDGSREFSGGGSLFYSNVSDLSGLTHWGAVVNLDYRGEFSPEFTAPWYGFSADFTWADFDDSEVREGYWAEIEAVLGKRFSPALGMSGGLRYFDRTQTGDGVAPAGANVNWQENKVFDQSRWGAFIHGDWFIGERTVLFAEYSYWDGDIASTARFPQQGTLSNNRDTFSWDEAFGPAGPGIENSWVVWKADAKKHIGEVGINFNLTDDLALGGSAIYVTSTDTRTETGSSSDYSNVTGLLSLTWSL
jgi:hypothetical protein